MCPEKMFELPVVELTDADCNIGSQWSVSRGNGQIKRIG